MMWFIKLEEGGKLTGCGDSRIQAETGSVDYGTRGFY